MIRFCDLFDLENIYFPIFESIGEKGVSLKEVFNPKGILYGLDRSYLKRKLVRRKR